MKPYGYETSAVSVLETCPCFKGRKYDRALSHDGKPRHRNGRNNAARGAKKRARQSVKQELRNYF